uniref:Uncharacterized protein n=1 Tax=Photinus pyralis TaxID=7054 RepID=A0A1Y1K952_PHOPY
MPKIFLIKNRLHQQQLRLLESQNAATTKSGDILYSGGEPQPLSLIVHKKEDREKEGNRDKKQTSLSDDEDSSAKKESVPPRRFISSILGGDVPYGSRGHVLTRAERKEYPPLVPPDKLVLPSVKEPSQTPSPQNLAPVRCSVIQRTPKTSKREEDNDTRIPTHIAIQEPEQDQPIDYHIPKRRGETEDENEERKNREQRRSHCSRFNKPLISVRALIGKLPVTMSAAAGHGRGSSGAQSNNNQASGSSSGGSGSINFSGGTSGSSGGGSVSGGSGNGGMNPGRDGRQTYGPSSPPTGSLPPFYESLKSGNAISNNYNSNNSCNQLNIPIHMDCDTGQELVNLNMNGAQNSPKQYSMLQNASYGLVMKDESDIDSYDTKIDPMGNLLPNSYSVYDDSMMVDMVTGAVVDPLQFTATLTFSSSAEHALLESLSDAADLSTFLQRLPNEENDNDEIITNEMHSPSITPDSHLQNVDHNMDSFSDQLLNRNYDNRGYQHQFGKLYPDSLPSYQPTVNTDVQMQIQQQMLSPSLSFNGNGIDLDSPTAVSMPSPGAASCSLESQNDSSSLSPPASISSRRESSSSEPPSLQGRVNLLQQRVSNILNLSCKTIKTMH